MKKMNTHATFGVLCLVIGLFALLVYLNIISSPQAQFPYGKLPVLSFSLVFLIIGSYLIFYRKKPKSKTLPNIFGLAIFILIPIHIIIYKDHANLSFYEFLISDWLWIILALMFDAVLIYIIAYSIKQKNKVIS